MVSEKAFYVSHNSFLYKGFYPLNEFSLIEEIYESVTQIYSNLNKIVFKANLNKLRTYYARIFSYGLNQVKAKDIILPKGLIISTLEETVFNMISSNLCVNAILRIEFRL